MPGRSEHKPFRFEVFGLDCFHGPVFPMLRVHSHAEVELNLIERGSLTYRLDQREVRLPAGTLAAFSGATAHELATAPPKGTRYFWLTVPMQTVLEWELPPAFTRALWRGEVAGSRDRRGYEHDRRLFERWNHDLHANDRALAKIVLMEVRARLERLALDFVPAAARTRNVKAGAKDKTGVKDAQPHRPSGSQHVAAMVRVILEHFQSPLTLEEIAAPTRLHPDRASHLFRRELGITPRAFLRRQRLVHAQRLLADTDDKITAIAAASGFPTLSRFYAAFAEELKMSPKTYRRERRC
jgi:AraC-like DNA-binding protein